MSEFRAIAQKESHRAGTSDTKSAVGGALQRWYAAHGRRIGPAILLLSCLAAACSLAIRQVRVLPLLQEVGFGDAYILQTVRTFQKTGVIYAAPSSTANLPGYSQYGPFLYILLSLPGRLFAAANPFIGPRMIEIFCFLLCVGVTASIGAELIPHRWGWRWSALLAISYSSMRGWILQIRGDFPAILLNLIAMRLLLSPAWWAPLAAGLAAGLSLQFKFIYVAGLAAGTLWLSLHRRWKDVAVFAGSGAVSSVGVAILLLQHEPRMLAHIFVLRQRITDFKGLFAFFQTLAAEPALVLGLAAAPLLLIRLHRRWLLISIYFMLSFAIAVIADLQVGGAVNYFFESLFAITPFAAFGALQFGARKYAAAGLLVAVLALFHTIAMSISIYVDIRLMLMTAVQNVTMQKLGPILAKRNVLSFVPNVTLLTRTPVISEPYLLSYLDRLGKFDLRPLEVRVRNQEFELVATNTEAQGWRGIRIIPDSLRPVLSAAYEPRCVYRDWLMMLPRNEAKSADLAGDLASIGCRPCTTGPDCNRW
jgi:hypothetical protein